MRIRFGTRPQGAIQRINQLKRDFLLGSTLPQAIEATHKAIEEIVRTNLRRSKRDPLATDPGTGVHEAAVAKNITSSVKRVENKITGGTGDISFMDRNDPLIAERSPEKETSRLWRILEWGVEPFNTLIARNPDKPMVFFWKRKNAWFVGKGINVTFVKYSPTFGGPVYIGYPPYVLPVSRPPIEGRGYFEASKFEARNLFVRNVSLVMEKMVQRR